MKNKLIILLIIIILVGVVYTFVKKDKVITQPEASSVVSNKNIPLNSDKVSLSNKEFLSVSNPQGKVIARGDINGDGYEDAIVEEMSCGASCSFNLNVIFNENNKYAKPLKPGSHANFEPAFLGSSAAKSEIISINNGIITIVGKGMACTNPNIEEPCTKEKWDVVKTVKYKFDGNEIVQISIN